MTSFPGNSSRNVPEVIFITASPSGTFRRSSGNWKVLPECSGDRCRNPESLRNVPAAISGSGTTSGPYAPLTARVHRSNAPDKLRIPLSNIIGRINFACFHLHHPLQIFISEDQHAPSLGKVFEQSPIVRVYLIR